MPTAVDPWAQVADSDGREKYRTLGVSLFASSEEVKRAYRELARRHHPDKGGDAAVFAAVQQAFETLSDSASRAVYDEWAKDLRFRLAPPSDNTARGGEDSMLDELARGGVACDPLTQLVVLCEVCRRPSTKECWTCKMPICSYCTLKRHWKDGFPLHWPLINSAHMQTQLAKRELEKKRIEDARLLDMEDPNWRSQAQLQDIRSFKVAACRMLDRKDRLVCYDYSLARFYMWAQTSLAVHIAVHVPTGHGDGELRVDCDGRLLRVQPQDSPPVVERALDGRVDASSPIESFRTADNQTLVISLRKEELGRQWPRLFVGDSDAVRCIEQPYRLAETPRDVSLEVDLPAWTDADDMRISIGPDCLRVQVRGAADCCRAYWTPLEERCRQSFRAVAVEESMWSLDRGAGSDGQQPAVVLLIHLVKPEPSEEEITWKKGKRLDNLSAERPGAAGKLGFRFFRDDEDEFGLEDVLQALCFFEAGRAYVPAKPWQQSRESRHVTQKHDLSEAAQRHLEAMVAAADAA